ncbi:CTP synthase C-terminal region-related (seleno)protein [Pedosphaera parvula]|uniref:CTP synthase (glutamine hydrolyzing) n=1 Tax=Pedosphaera parvula (strain Ellin514) TaxID=320771 RepID=B9XHE8_PEDPL|nr:glutamine amidotransferase [Pedosphaera parvula]EEF60783.1 glutamine amidotransferase class-I [Pedosphaera parvula Ellin514]
MQATRIALVGDFNSKVIAHQAINASFALWNSSTAKPIAPIWTGTDTILPGNDSLFTDFQGIWCVPASPYKSIDGALWAIQFARTRSHPFLGTCGGFQHALLEYARNALNLATANHTELDPSTEFPLLHRMQCSLVEKSQIISATGHGRFTSMYGATEGTEAFHCSYGLNPAYENLFQNTPLQITARSEDNEIRAIELTNHPFFLATLFQPERKALTGQLHPLVHSFFSAAASCALKNA